MVSGVSNTIRPSSLARSWERPTNISVILITVIQITLAPIDKERADSIRVKSGGVCYRMPDSSVVQASWRVPL
jgi:hypothetical protein